MFRGSPWSHWPFRRFALLFAALLVLSSLPLLTTGLLPLVDYPNHLARMQLLARLSAVPVLQQYYTLAWAPIPDLAMDLLVPPLLHFVPLLVAGKLFVLVTFFLLAGGPAALHRVLFGRWSAWPCLAFLLLYGRLLLWGMLNYLFGLGLALFALAAWLALADRPPALRLALGLVFAGALYLAHLMAFGVYAVLLVGYTAGTLWRRRPAPGRALAAMALALVPLCVPLAVMLLAGGGMTAGVVRFSAPWRKLDLLFSVFDLYHRGFDVAGFVLVVVAGGLAYWRRWLVLAPAMAWPLALLVLAYLVMPTQLMTASGVDRRLPLAIFLVLFGASRWIAPKPGLERLYLGGAGLLLLLRLMTVAIGWQASGREYRALMAGLDAVPLGSRLAVAYPAAAVNVTATPLMHFPVLAAARREAFVPTLFAYPGQQPVAFRPRFRALAAALPADRLWAAFVRGAPPLDGAERKALAAYDYIAFSGVAPFTLANPRGLAPAFLSPRFQIYRLARR